MSGGWETVSTHGDSSQDDGWEDADTSLWGKAKQFAKDFAGSGAALADMVGSAPGMLGVATAAMGDIPDVIKGKKRMTHLIDEVMEVGTEHSMLPFSKTAVAKNPGYQNMGKVFSMPAEGYGAIADAAGNPELGDTLRENMNQGLYGPMMVAGMGGRMPKPGSAEAYRATDQAIRKGQSADPGEIPIRQVPKPGEWEDMPADLFGKDQPSPIPPGTRSPYNLSPEQIRAGEQDMRDTAAEAGRAGQRQGDLFQTPMEDLQRRTSEGVTGARDKPEVEIIPSDREGNAPGIYPETQPRGEFQSREPARETPIEPLTLDSKTVAEVIKDKSLKDAPPVIQEFLLYNKALEHHLTSGVESTRRAMEIVRDTTTVPFYRELAKKLLEDKEFNPRHEVRDMIDRGADPMRDPAGRYLPESHKILTKGQYAGSEKIFMHENMHGATHSVIQGVLDGHKQFDWAKPIVRRLNALYESFKHEAMKRDEKGPFKDHIEELHKEGKGAFESAREIGSWSGEYGLKNLHEFMADGYTNPHFQQKLRDTPLPREFRDGFFRNYWDKFINTVSQLFGMKRSDANYLSELLKVGSDIIDGASAKDREFYADQNIMSLMKKSSPWKMDSEITGNFSPKEIDRKGVVETMQEAKRVFDLDKRPIEEVIKSLPKTLEDFTGKAANQLERIMDRLGSLVKSNLLQDTTLKGLMSEKPGTGTLLKWTVDQVSRIEREAQIRIKGWLDHALSPFRKSVRSPQGKLEMIEAWKTWKEHIGEKDLTVSDFKNERQFKMYERFQQVFQEVLTKVNEKRESAGLKPISRIPSYFHSMWEGDYAVNVTDSAGNKHITQRFTTEWQAERMAKAYRSARPDMVVETGHIQQNKYGLKNFSAFEEAIRVMADNTPVQQALLEVYREVLGKKGFGKTGIHRKGVLGFLGSEEGFLGLKNMERSFEQYIGHANHYISNLDKQKVLQDLQKIPKEQRNSIPETMDFLSSYIQRTQGQKGDFPLERLLKDLTKAVGLGESVPIRGIRQLSSVASIYWLVTPKFWLSQTSQSINALPKLIQEHGTFGGTKMFFDGWANTIKPDTVAKEAAEWASKRGYLDATIKNLLGKDLSDIPIHSNFEAAKELLTYPAAKIEHQLVRLPTFLMFEKALRDTVKDPEARFAEAAEKMDHYMVNYGRSHAPAILDKAGMVGEGLRPLKQYSVNYFGQFLEYAMDAKNRHNVAPLASFFGTQIAVGGLKGVLFVAEATAAITMLNYLFDTEIPTPEQLLVKSGLPDALVFGGLSTVLQQDVSSSSAAPGLPSMFTFPAVDFTKKMVSDAGNYLIKKAHGKDTDQDRLRAALAVSPNAMHEFWKNVFTPSGMPTANPNDPQLRGNYRRTETEALWSGMTGAKPLDESKADMLIRATKQELKKDYERKMDALDAITDRIMNGQPIDPKLFQSYVKEGGDPSSLGRTIATRIKERMLTGQERTMEGSMTPAQRHKIETLQKYLEQKTPSSNEPLGMNGAGEFVQLADSTTKSKREIDNKEAARRLDPKFAVDPDRNLTAEEKDDLKIRFHKFNVTPDRLRWGKVRAQKVQI